MKRIPLSWLLLANFLVLRYVFCQRASTNAELLSGRRRFQTGVCDTHVENNAVTVNDQTPQDIKASHTLFQDVVDCLNPGGIIRFATERFSVNETIRIDKDVSITSTARKKTSFICNGQPVFDIRSTFPHFHKTG